MHKHAHAAVADSDADITRTFVGASGAVYCVRPPVCLRVFFSFLTCFRTFHELKAHKNRVSCLGVNYTGQALCTGSWDTELAVWA